MATPFETAFKALLDSYPLADKDAVALAWNNLYDDFIAGREINGTPSNSEVPTWNSATSKWDFAVPAGGAAHDLGGAQHNADSLANLNSKVTGGSLDFDTASRTPLAHKTDHQNGGGDEISVAGLSGLLADAQTPTAHTHSHASTTGKTANDHHAQLHAAAHASGGSDKMASLEILGASQLMKFISGLLSVNSTGTSADVGAFGLKTFDLERQSSSNAFETIVEVDTNNQEAAVLLYVTSHDASDVAKFHTHMDTQTGYKKSGTFTRVGHGGPIRDILNGGISAKVDLSGQTSPDRFVLAYKGDGTNVYHVHGFAFWIKGDLS